MFGVGSTYVGASAKFFLRNGCLNEFTKHYLQIGFPRNPHTFLPLLIPTCFRLSPEKKLLYLHLPRFPLSLFHHSNCFTFQ